jgi:hypothetical protein
VRFLGYGINNALPTSMQVPNGAVNVFEALATRAGGEALDANSY